MSRPETPTEVSEDEETTEQITIISEPPGKIIEKNTSYIEKYPLFSTYINTKIFELKNENSVITIKPECLTFEFNAETMEMITSKHEFKILNIASHPVKILVLPTQTEFFKFIYRQTNWLVPGVSLIIDVHFKPTDPRTYSDWLRVNCNAESNLMVPIKAIPIHTNSTNIPKKINFGFVPIGETAVYNMVLQPVKDETINFMFVVAKNIPGCLIIPTEGKVEKDPVEIIISYTPNSYITVSIPVQLFLPPIVMTPHYFTIEAHTKPVCKSEKVEVIKEDAAPKENSISESRQEKSSTQSKKEMVKQQRQQSVNKCELEIRPLTPHDINTLLLRKRPFVRDPYEQLGPYGLYLDECQELKDKAFKEFLRIANQLKEEDAIARIKKKERIFKINSSDEIRNRIKSEYLALQDEYQTALHPINEEMFPIYIRQKIIASHKKGVSKQQGKKYDMWNIRYQTLWKFLQSSRIILVKMRMLRRLEVFKKLTPEKILELENEVQ